MLPNLPLRWQIGGNAGESRGRGRRRQHWPVVLAQQRRQQSQTQAPDLAQEQRRQQSQTQAPDLAQEQRRQPPKPPDYLSCSSNFANRRRVSSWPKIRIESKTGMETFDPLIATNNGAKASRGLMPAVSTKAVPRAS